jgi:hypothetical protein
MTIESPRRGARWRRNILAPRDIRASLSGCADGRDPLTRTYQLAPESTVANSPAPLQVIQLTGNSPCMRNRQNGRAAEGRTTKSRTSTQSDTDGRKGPVESAILAFAGVEAAIHEAASK